jgi:hypothetical protein
MLDIPKIGSLAAMAACVSTVLYGVAQLLQIVHVLRPPLDGILIFGFSLCIVVPFLIAVLAFHHSAQAERKFWSGAAMIFTIMYGTYVTLNYTVQLFTVIPAVAQGRHEQVRMLDQSPHSLAWDLDALGYICMGIATLCGSFAFDTQGVGKYAKAFFLANACMTPIIAAIYFYPTFSIPLLLLGSPWIVTASGSMFCLAIYLRRQCTASPTR